MASSAQVEAAIQERERRKAAGIYKGGTSTPNPPTVAAGQSTGFGRTMTNAEASYQSALEEGYDPTTPKNSTASAIEGIPLVPGTRQFGQWLRDDISDRGRQAELEWTDAELRSVSGAAAPEPEVARKAATYFPGGGQKLNEIGEQMRRSRETSYGSAVIRSGGAIPKDRAYGQVYDPQPQSYWDALPPEQMKTARLYGGSKAASGTTGNPTVIPNRRAYSLLPVGNVYIDGDGGVYRKGNGEAPDARLR